MRFLFYVVMWRWYHHRGRRLARAAGLAQRTAANFRELAYADAEGHAERVGFMAQKPR